MPAPAPLARRGRFPVRQRRDTSQLSLFGLMVAVETHPDLAEGLRPMALTLRKMAAAHMARASVIDVTGEVLDEREVAR